MSRERRRHRDRRHRRPHGVALAQATVTPRSRAFGDRRFGRTERSARVHSHTAAIRRYLASPTTSRSSFSTASACCARAGPGSCCVTIAAAAFACSRRRRRSVPRSTQHYGLDPISYETNILLEDGNAWLKSEGTIRMFERLGFPWSLLAAARVVPRALRDRLYNVVARNRLRWFGSRETCFAAGSRRRGSIRTMSEARVLIVGGYGVFGGRIVALLEDEPRLTLIVAGRSLSRAEELVRSRRPAAKLEAASVRPRRRRRGAACPARADRRRRCERSVSGVRRCALPRSSRHASRCARTISISPTARSSLPASARSMRRRVRQACSVWPECRRFPMLTAAVVRRLANGMRVDSIRAGIAPSPFAGVGANVIRAIASYAGQRVHLRKNGTSSHGFPFTEHLRFTIAPPGRLPLRSTLFSLVDVPDLRVLAEFWPEIKSVWMGAGPVPEILHRALIRARVARPRRSRSFAIADRAVDPLRDESRSLGRASRRNVRRGLGRDAAGDGRPSDPGISRGRRRRSVDSVDGRRSHRSQAARRRCAGARCAARDRSLELADYERLFARRTIYTGVRSDSGDGPLYARLLGPAWDELPARDSCDARSAR